MATKVKEKKSVKQQIEEVRLVCDAGGRDALVFDGSSFMIITEDADGRKESRDVFPEDMDDLRAFAQALIDFANQIDEEEF